MSTPSSRPPWILRTLEPTIPLHNVNDHVIASMASQLCSSFMGKSAYSSGCWSLRWRPPHSIDDIEYSTISPAGSSQSTPERGLHPWRWRRPGWQPESDQKNISFLVSKSSSMSSSMFRRACASSSRCSSIVTGRLLFRSRVCRRELFRLYGSW